MEGPVARNPLLGPVPLNTLPVQEVEADDISSALVFLVPDESRHVTGRECTVDAGAADR
jgi:enoyl-[acyl-carrier-protein] reductase (NADH)